MDSSFRIALLGLTAIFYLTITTVACSQVEREFQSDAEAEPSVAATLTEIVPSTPEASKTSSSTLGLQTPSDQAGSEARATPEIEANVDAVQTPNATIASTEDHDNEDPPILPTSAPEGDSTPTVDDGSTLDNSSLKFMRQYVDLDYGGNGRPGWALSGDMDGDGDIDIVAGGGFAIYIYENDGNAQGWKRYGNLDSTGRIGANGGALYDVDGDNDLDVVSAKFNQDLGWWENPGGALSNSPWSFHELSKGNDRYLHDIIRVDLDKNGQAEEFVANLNEGYGNAKITLKWFRPGGNPKQLWESHTIEGDRTESAHGHAGLDAGDIDDDGDIDLAYANGWYESSGNPEGNWTWHQVANIYGISNALLRDMDGDEALDLVVTAGHHGQGAFWFENGGGSGPINWTRHDISAVVGDVTRRHRYSNNEPEHLHHPECLQVLDLNGDSELDVVTCDLFFGEDTGEPGWDEEIHNVYVYENAGGAAGWNKQNVAPNSYPNHLLQMVDVNQDGRMDIISESTGYSVVSYFERSTR